MVEYFISFVRKSIMSSRYVFLREKSARQSVGITVLLFALWHGRKAHVKTAGHFLSALRRLWSVLLYMALSSLVNLSCHPMLYVDHKPALGVPHPGTCLQCVAPDSRTMRDGSIGSQWGSIWIWRLWTTSLLGHDRYRWINGGHR